MRLIIFVIILFNADSLFAQNRVNKISINSLQSFYSYGEGQGDLNNVVRLGEDIIIRYKTYDSIKAKGMIYELAISNRVGYYRNILGSNRVLEVSDLHAGMNFIFPVMIIHKKSMEHSLGVGIGVSTLMGRDYLDEANNILPFNSTNLKELKFGRYWTSTLLLDYEFSFNLSKKIGFIVGFRYTNPTPIDSENVDYKISQGISLGFKFGMFYKF